MSSKTRSNAAQPPRDPEREFEDLRRQLAQVGYLIKGSLQVRRTVCGDASCRCRKGPRFGHGPYYWWTSKVAGKTVTLILSKEEGELFVGWAKNRQRLDAIVEKMYRVSAQVARAKLGRPPPWFRKK